MRVANIEVVTLVCTTLSFFATYFFTNEIFQKLRCTRQYPADGDEPELQSQLRDVDSSPITSEWPREDFLFSMEPWEVKRRMDSKRFVCPRTSQANPIKVVVMIKSAPSYFNRRDAIRKTWGTISHLENMVVHYIFIVGTARAEVQHGLRKENAVNGDILQYIGIDDYTHVTHKVLAGMQWTTTKVTDDYFYASSDDDMIVNIKDIPKRLRLQIKLATSGVAEYSNVPRGSVLSRVPILCIYSYIEKESPIRDPNSKYFLDLKDYPMEALPPHCRGGFYMIPVANVAKLYDISRSHKALPMDDVWITGVLRNLLPKHERSIDAIDESAKNQISSSGHIVHLMGDIEGGPTLKPSEALLAKWAEIYKILARKKHCLVNEVKV